jgi:two-component system chemotaxis response regulator CheY
MRAAPAAWTFSRETNNMKTILAVDDSATMREMVAFVLESAGYRVIEAEDGAQGLDRATANSVDLVITDQNMPNMDGLTLVRSLRELRDYKSTPILLLTTESSDAMKAQGRAAGATGWLVKPFDPATLLEVVGKVLR